MGGLLKFYEVLILKSVKKGQFPSERTKTGARSTQVGQITGGSSTQVGQITGGSCTQVGQTTGGSSKQVGQITGGSSSGEGAAHYWRSLHCRGQPRPKTKKGGKRMDSKEIGNR